MDEGNQQAIFKIFYYKTEYRAHQQFPPNTVKCTLLDGTMSKRLDFRENLSSLSVTGKLQQEWNGEKAGRQDAGLTLNKIIGPSRGEEPHPGLWATHSCGSNLSRDDLLWTGNSNSPQLQATTSYSLALALQLRYAGKCNFSFGDYKTHVPKEGGKKNLQ